MSTSGEGALRLSFDEAAEAFRFKSGGWIEIASGTDTATASGFLDSGAVYATGEYSELLLAYYVNSQADGTGLSITAFGYMAQAATKAVSGALAPDAYTGSLTAPVATSYLTCQWGVGVTAATTTTAAVTSRITGTKPFPYTKLYATKAGFSALNGSWWLVGR